MASEGRNIAPNMWNNGRGVLNSQSLPYYGRAVKATYISEGALGKTAFLISPPSFITPFLPIEIALLT